MEAIKLRVRVREDGTIEWPALPPGLPAGEAEIILLYPPASEHGQAKPATSADEQRLAANWPVLNGGQWYDGSFRREDLYGDEER